MATRFCIPVVSFSVTIPFFFFFFLVIGLLLFSFGAWLGSLLIFSWE